MAGMKPKKKVAVKKKAPMSQNRNRNREMLGNGAAGRSMDKLKKKYENY